MAHKNKIATVFGGTGFVGRQIVRELAALGMVVKVATRATEKAYALKPYGAPGQVVGVACDYRKPESIAQAVKGADYVVNCVGILYERGKRRTFTHAHVDVPEMIAKACKGEGVKKFVHISALACDEGSSRYARSKHAGEQAVFKVYAGATVLRPSIIFGKGDSFFNMFAEIARYVPVLPLIGGGKTKFQPVFVGDVADAAVRILSDKGQSFEGRVYHLGGAEILNFQEIYERMFRYTGRRRMLLPLPFAVAKIEAFALALLPRPLLTPDQVESLKTDNIVKEGAFGLRHLGITPTSLDSVLPTYLEMYRRGGKFAAV